MVLRDSQTGSMILRQMMTMRSLGNQMSQKGNLIDEIGVLVVDGNFSLYGKILFANKILVKSLGYKTEDLKGKLIH